VADEHEILPHAVVLIRHASLPVTTSGKVQRSLARRLYIAGELKVLEEWVAPQNGAVPRGASEHRRPNSSGHVNGNGKPHFDHSLGNGRSHGNGNGNGKVNGNGRHAGNGRHRLKNAVEQGRPHGESANGASQPVPTNGAVKGPAAVNGHARRKKISRIDFDHFPLSAEEIDRLAEQIEKWILDWMIEHAAVSAAEIDRHKPFAEYGMDSLTAVELSHQLEEWLGVELTAVIAWNYPTPHKISQYLARTVGGAETAETAVNDSSGESASGDDFERLLAEIENLSESEAQDALSRDNSSA
jgi:acyl carrier protein